KTDDDTLELRFNVAGPSLSGSLEIVEPITLVWTSPHYGGRRPWFRCEGHEAVRPGPDRRLLEAIFPDLLLYEPLGTHERRGPNSGPSRPGARRDGRRRGCG